MQQTPSIAAMRFVRAVTGRTVGGSTGTNAWGALRLAAQMRASDQRGSIVTLICDHGERYTDTYYDDTWIQEQGLELTPYAETLEHCLATGEWREP
jgi:cysteine synthase A